MNRPACHECADGRPERAAIFHPQNPLVGRERELATLRDARVALLAGRGPLGLIGDVADEDPGIRLVHAQVREAVYVGVPPLC